MLWQCCFSILVWTSPLIIPRLLDVSRSILNGSYLYKAVQFLLTILQFCLDTYFFPILVDSFKIN